LLANDEVRTTLSTRLVDLLNQRVDVQAQLEEKLPAASEGRPRPRSQRPSRTPRDR
jgi:hypothetical protein